MCFLEGTETAINGTTLQVNFNRAVNASTLYNTTTGVIDASALTLTGTSAAAAVTPANLRGALSADGKTLTVSVSGDSEFFKGTYALELLADKVAVKENASVFVEEFKTLTTVSDVTGPTISGVTYDGTSAVVAFSEPIKTEGVVSLNGVQLTSGTDYKAVTAGDTTLTVYNLVAGTPSTLTIVSATDVRRFKSWIPRCL